jgi:hypothetical protein
MFSASINGKEVYIQVNTAANSTDSKSYNIEILELELMQQNIAIDLNEAIGKDGKINVSRLKSEGVGSLCPVTSNTTVEGKALNRRVEIVNQ